LQYTENLERSLNVVSPYFDIGCMHSDARIDVGLQLQNRYMPIQGRVTWHAYNRCEGS